MLLLSLQVCISGFFQMYVCMLTEFLSILLLSFASSRHPYFLGERLVQFVRTISSVIVHRGSKVCLNIHRKRMIDNMPRMRACGVLQSTVPTYEMVKCSLLIGLVYCYLVTRSRFISSSRLSPTHLHSEMLLGLTS